MQNFSQYMKIHFLHPIFGPFSQTVMTLPVINIQKNKICWIKQQYVSRLWLKELKCMLSFCIFFHAKYSDLQWKGLLKCAINVSTKTVRDGGKAEDDLISMCQRCSSSCCLFSTDFCFCLRSLTSRSFRARLLGLISTGRSGFTFF